jgi:4-nitrophenyl phosphatase
VATLGLTKADPGAAPAGLIVDMDGVLYRGEQPMPGLTEFFEFARAHPFALVTNNSTVTALDCQRKLARMGVDVPASAVLTVSDTTALYLAGAPLPGRRAMVLGSPVLKEAIAGVGIELVGSSADVVVIGLDTHLTYATLAEAVRSISKGAAFVATSFDPVLLTEEGTAPGSGAIVAAVQACVAATPVCVGKPSAAMFETAAALLGFRPDQTLVVGDNPGSDIAGGAAVGARTALLLSGVADALALGGPRPDFVFAGLPALTEFLRGSIGSG